MAGISAHHTGARTTPAAGNLLMDVDEQAKRFRFHAERWVRAVRNGGLTRFLGHEGCVVIMSPETAAVKGVEDGGARG